MTTYRRPLKELIDFFSETILGSEFIEELSIFENLLKDIEKKISSVKTYQDLEFLLDEIYGCESRAIKTFFENNYKTQYPGLLKSKLIDEDPHVFPVEKRHHPNGGLCFYDGKYNKEDDKEFKNYIDYFSEKIGSIEALCKGIKEQLGTDSQKMNHLVESEKERVKESLFSEKTDTETRRRKTDEITKENLSERETTLKKKFLVIETAMELMSGDYGLNVVGEINSEEWKSIQWKSEIYLREKFDCYLDPCWVPYQYQSFLINEIRPIPISKDNQKPFLYRKNRVIPYMYQKLAVTIGENFFNKTKKKRFKSIFIFPFIVPVKEIVETLLEMGILKPVFPQNLLQQDPLDLDHTKNLIHNSSISDNLEKLTSHPHTTFPWMLDKQCVYNWIVGSGFITERKKKHLSGKGGSEEAFSSVTSNKMLFVSKDSFDSYMNQKESVLNTVIERMESIDFSYNQFLNCYDTFKGTLPFVATLKYFSKERKRDELLKCAIDKGIINFLEEKQKNSLVPTNFQRLELIAENKHTHENVKDLYEEGYKTLKSYDEKTHDIIEPIEAIQEQLVSKLKELSPESLLKEVVTVKDNYRRSKNTFPKDYKKYCVFASQWGEWKPDEYFRGKMKDIFKEIEAVIFTLKNLLIEGLQNQLFYVKSAIEEHATIGENNPLQPSFSKLCYFFRAYKFSETFYKYCVEYANSTDETTKKGLEKEILHFLKKNELQLSSRSYFFHIGTEEPLPSDLQEIEKQFEKDEAQKKQESQDQRRRTEKENQIKREEHIRNAKIKQTERLQDVTDSDDNKRLLKEKQLAILKSEKEAYRLYPKYEGTPYEKDFFKRKTTQEELFLKPSELESHSYSVGGSGSGKSENMKYRIAQMLQSPNYKPTIIILDHHGKFAREIARWNFVNEDDLIYIEPKLETHNFILNPFHAPQKQTKYSIEGMNKMLVYAFQSLVRAEWSTNMGIILEYCIPLVIENKGNFSSLLDLIGDTKTPKYKELIAKAKKSPNKQVQEYFSGFFQDDTNDSTKKSLYKRLSGMYRNMVFQEFVEGNNTLDFKEALNGGKLIVCNTNEAIETGILVFAQILNTLSQRNPEKKNSHVHFFVDECGRYFAGREMVETILNEYRKFGLSLHLAQQYVGQHADTALVKSIFANCSLFFTGYAEERSRKRVSEETNTNILDLESIQRESYKFLLSKAGISNHLYRYPDDYIDKRQGISDTEWKNRLNRQIEKYYVPTGTQKVTTEDEVKESFSPAKSRDDLKGKKVNPSE